MKQLNLFIELTRLNKPIGYMLLFWPCLWGLTIAYDFNYSLHQFIFYSLLFFLGSVLMRSAGCIVNDIADKNFDKKVKRTKNMNTIFEGVRKTLRSLSVTKEEYMTIPTREIFEVELCTDAMLFGERFEEQRRKKRRGDV